MVRLSNSLIGVLNIATMVLSIAIMSSGFWLSHRASSTTCEKFLEKPLVVLGVFLLVVSLAGLVGACCRNTCLLWIYLCAMFVLILVIFCFALFAFFVTNKSAGEAVSGQGFMQYRLGDYSHWLQKRMENSENWGKIKSCLQDVNVCTSLEGKNDTLNQLFEEDLSPVQSGCCMPPTECNFTYMSPTVWDKPTGFDSSSISDCNTWQNDPSTLCFDCQSCKAGFLAIITKDWKKVSIANIIFLISLVVVYSVGCCAYRNNRAENSYVRAKGYP